MVSSPLGTLHAMVLAGLSDALVGRAAKELLVGEKAADPGPHGARLPSRGSSTLLTEPPVSALHRDVSPAQPLAAATSADKGMAPIKVRLENGTVTNVVIPRGLLDELAGLEGSEELARRKLRQLAQGPLVAGTNRSGWVQRQVKALLSGAPTVPGSA